MDNNELRQEDMSQNTGSEDQENIRADYGRSRADKGRGRRQLSFLALVAVIVIAVVAVTMVVSDKRRKAEDESIAASLAAEQEAAEENKGYELSEFEECSIPELNMLASEYFDARLAGDTDKLAEILGQAAVDSDAELATRLKAQADWIQSYSLKKVYTANGLDENSRLCLVLYDIDFRRTDTLAPGVMYFYAIRDDAGNYTIVENPVKEIHDYILAELQTDSAKSIIDDSNARLKEALDQDSTLALIYVSFESGEIYKESDLDVNRDQEVGFSAEDSILVDDSVLADIENEAAEEASIEASLAAEDETETAAAEDDTASEETESAAEAEADVNVDAAQ